MTSRSTVREAPRSPRSATPSPICRLYRGRIFVIKLGGSALADAAALARGGRADRAAPPSRHPDRARPRRRAADQRAARAASGSRRARSPAAGSPTTRRSKRSTMTLNGSGNTALLAACRAARLPAVGLSGVDGGLVRAAPPPAGRVEGESAPVDYGHVGDIERVDPTAARRPARRGLRAGRRAARRRAEGQRAQPQRRRRRLGARRARSAREALFLVDTPGLLEAPDDPDSLVSYADLAGSPAARRAARSCGGMLPKTRASRRPCAAACARVHLVSCTAPDALLLEVFTNEGAGTLIVPDSRRSRRRAARRSRRPDEPPDARRRLCSRSTASWSAIPSVSGERGARSPTSSRVCLAERGRAARADRRLLLARRRRRRRCSLLDTPPRHRAAGSRLDARSLRRDASSTARVHGLGANDAKASVAAMIAAFLALARRDAGRRRRPRARRAARRRRTRDARHARPSSPPPDARSPARCSASRPGSTSPWRRRDCSCSSSRPSGEAATRRTRARSARRTPSRGLARDLVALDDVDLGPTHPLLGPTTLEPTVVARRHGAQRRAGRGDGDPRRAHDAGAPPAGRSRGCAPAVAGEMRVRLRPLRGRCEIAAGSALHRRARAPRARRRAATARRRSPTWRPFRRHARRSRSGPGAPSARTRPTSSCSRARSSTGRASTRPARAIRPPVAARRPRRRGGARMSRLWGRRRAASTRACSPTRQARTTCSTRASSPYDVRASIAHAGDARARRACSPPTTSPRSARGLAALGDEHARGLWRIELADEDVPHRARAPARRPHRRRRRPRPPRPLAQRPGARGAAALPQGRASPRSPRGARAVGGGARRARRRASGPGAAGLHAHPARHALLGRAVGRRLRRRARATTRSASRPARRRADRNPLGSAAGYGAPGAAARPRGDARRARLRGDRTSR